MILKFDVISLISVTKTLFMVIFSITSSSISTESFLNKAIRLEFDPLSLK